MSVPQATSALSRAAARIAVPKTYDAVPLLLTCDPSTTWIAWSGGKDSTALLQLAINEWGDDTRVLCSWRGASDHPDLADLIERTANRWPLLELVVRPSVTANDATDRQSLHNLATRLGITTVCLGLRRGESGRRRAALTSLAPRGEYQAGPEWGRLRTVVPLHRWTTDDVWRYIDHHDTPYLAHYDRMGRHTRSPHQ